MFFCRALYDYQSQDSSSLSFYKGDIIEVLTKLDSGWWDGLLNDERGWFPSNYVQRISDQEADAELSSSDFFASAPDQQPTTTFHTIEGRAQFDRDWTREDTEIEPAQDHNVYSNGRIANPPMSNDFWVNTLK